MPPKPAPAKTPVKAAAAPVKKSTTTSTTQPTRGSSPPKAGGGGRGAGGPPPPPPPPPKASAAPAPRATVAAPTVAAAGPAGAVLVSLAIFNGHPFKDHWALFVRTSKTSQKGIMIHAAGDVKKGFTFEIKRNIDFSKTSQKPQLIDLQWVDAKHFNQAMWINGVYDVETPGKPACPFEVSAAKAPAPQKSLNAVDDLAPTAAAPTRITQRNCQTWVVEAVEKLVADTMLLQAALTYVKAKKQ